MTKEEILSKKHWSVEYPNYMAEGEILDAMDEYAAQESMKESIDFLEWACWQPGLDYMIAPPHTVKFSLYSDPLRQEPPKRLSINELYELYLQSKK